MAQGRTALLVEVDVELAAAYKSAYEEVMGSSKLTAFSLAAFISRFVNDRLVEELKFIQTEYP